MTKYIAFLAYGWFLIIGGALVIALTPCAVLWGHKLQYTQTSDAGYLSDRLLLGQILPLLVLGIAAVFLGVYLRQHAQQYERHVVAPPTKRR